MWGFRERDWEIVEWYVAEYELSFVSVIEYVVKGEVENCERWSLDCEVLILFEFPAS